MPHKDPQSRREYMRKYRAERLKTDPVFKAKHLAKMRERARRRSTRIRKITAEAKLTCGCVRCGYRENGMALQWDHPEPVLRKTTTGQGRIVGRNSTSWTSAWRTIMECQVLCANCHAIKTGEEHQGRLSTIRFPDESPTLR